MMDDARFLATVLLAAHQRDAVKIARNGIRNQADVLLILSVKLSASARQLLLPKTCKGLPVAPKS